MDPPGPGGLPWAGELLLFAAAFVVLGEAIRLALASRVPFFRGLEPLGRAVVDLYLGGAALYAIAALPLGLFVPVTPLVVLGAGAVGLAIAVARTRRPAERLRPLATMLARPPYLIALACAATVFAIEVAAAGPVATGNTFDSSLYTTYVALLLGHGTLPLTYAPLAAQGLPYPQGATVWFASAQVLLGLPPARVSLLVTPLFLAAAVPAAFVLARRWLASEYGGAAASVVLALFASWPRTMVGGSNDFVLALPLVLVVAGESGGWLRSGLPTWRDAVALGALLGYSAALNPVGAQWWFLALPAAAALGRPRFGGALRGWWARWAAALAAGIVFVLPSLSVLARGWRSPFLTPGSAPLPPGTSVALPWSGWVGALDPFLFGSGQVALSPFLPTRIELAALLVVGAFLLLRPGPLGDRLRLDGRDLGRRALAGILVPAGILALAATAAPGLPLVGALPYVTSAGELSVLAFVIFALVASYPIAEVLERGGPPRAAAGRPDGARPPHPARDGTLWSPAIAGLLAVALVLPGVAATTVELPGYLRGTYGEFSHVSPEDFALLAWCRGHLGPGDRVLVAPGSLAEFVPGYAPAIVLFYPMMANYPAANASYATAVAELTHGTLDATGRSALAALDLRWILVTQNNSVLYPAFDPAPLLGDPGWSPAFHQGDAYAFERVGAG